MPWLSICPHLCSFFMIPAQTLRAANAGLYIGCVLFVIFACIYVAITRELSTLAFIGIIAAGAFCSLWGVHYAVLRYRADAEGITYRSLWRRTHLLWQEVTEVNYTETDSAGVASCRLVLTSPKLCLTLSSDLLPLDAVRDLALDLHHCGLLKEAPTPTE